MTAKQKVFTSILDYWSSSHQLGPSGSNIKINGRTHNYNQFNKKWSQEKNALLGHVGAGEYYKIVEEIKNDRGVDLEAAETYMTEKVFQGLVKTLTAKKKEGVTKASITDFRTYAFDYAMYLPIINIQDSQKGLFNLQKNTYSRGLSFDSWEKWVNFQDADDKKILKQSVMPAIISYNPYEDNEYKLGPFEEQSEVLQVNAHSMPEWRIGGVPEITPKEMPEKFKKLMKSLFKTDKDIEYVCHWMNFMLTGRAETILFLYGPQGNGKGTFAEICRLLVGDSNFNRVGTDFWENKFNGELLYRRLAFFDEGEITRDSVNKVRSITNSSINIEVKGKTPITMKNHCSYIWTSNEDRIHYVRSEDRRYSVPNLNEKDLNESLGIDFVDDLMTLINTGDLEFVRAIGYWIINHGDKGSYDPNTAFKSTENFHRLVRNGLANWEKKLIEMIESREYEEYIYDEILQKQLGGTGRDKMAQFLKIYRDKDGDQVASVCRSKKQGEAYIIPEDKYKPEVQESVVDDFDAEDMEF